MFTDLILFTTYLGAILLVVAGMMTASAFLGARHRETATGEPYESGIRGSGRSRIRFGAHYYLVAMVFVIFDLEAAFLFAWAVGARELGKAPFVEILVFVGNLLVAWVWLWRVGGLDWGPKRRPRVPVTGRTGADRGSRGGAVT